MSYGCALLLGALVAVLVGDADGPHVGLLAVSLVGISKLDEDWLTPAQVAKALPKRNGKHVSLPSVWRYLGPRGCRGVRLKSTLIGGRRMVARSDLEAWLEALSTSSEVPASSSSYPQTIAQRAREDAEAERLRL